MAKIPRQIVQRPEKTCNRCGQYTGVYIVWKNAPICQNCAEELKLTEPKKVPNEKTMINKILKNSKLI